MNIAEYIHIIKQEIERGVYTEHSFRGYLQSFLANSFTEFEVTNEPKRQACGAPDYIVAKKGVPVGFIEAKDIGIDLDRIEKSEQLSRYLKSLDNLILTDYLEFRFYRFSKLIDKVKIASLQHGKLKANTEDFEHFEFLLKEFFTFSGQTIKSPDSLARMMADKARLMQEIIYKALESGDSDEEGLESQYEAFKNILIHDLDRRQFADIYAQTITYGLFAARLNDQNLKTFTRQEASYLVPKTNPFLFQLFSYVAGPTLDDRIAWVVDALADIFNACDVQSLLADFGTDTMSTDPFIHFYETFLAEYDPALRKSRGVYYTPEPVVSFIVRSVDKILENDFELPMGLADTSKITIEVEKQGQAKKVKESVHRVQVLDPATGTGTFLKEVFKQIYSRFQGQQGLWSSYVEENLLPRIHGFEILMAPYAMCHLKLGLFLQQTGYQPSNPMKPKRLNVYLTNSLEEAHPDTGTLFAQWLSKEATAANIVKRDTPVMVVLGNPPYSNFGQMNKGKWIINLIADYKKDLHERKINLDDDYIKFIRYAEYYIEKNGYGIVAMITNNSYINGITHRKMREHLMATFDNIYVLDLHGSTKNKETTPDGNKDENIFDIKQGVAIILMVKKQGRSKKPAIVRHAELYGLREYKYHELFSHDVTTIEWEKINTKEPNYFFVPKKGMISETYKKFFSIKTFFTYMNSGTQTKRDHLCVQMSIQEMKTAIHDVLCCSKEEVTEKYKLPPDGRDWSFEMAKKDLLNNHPKIIPFLYRVFDFRYTVYTGKSKGFIAYPRQELHRNFIEKDNIGLIINRQIVNESFSHAGLSKIPICTGTFYLGNQGQDYLIPLYLYSDSDELDGSVRRPNLNMDIIYDIAARLNLYFIPDHKDKKAQSLSGEKSESVFTPLDILDYIYAILHSPTYREKYNEFLKTDFPRIPYPESTQMFFSLAEKGARLRSFHLMEAVELNSLITSYPYFGNNRVEQVKWESLGKDKPESYGAVRINPEQRFEGVPRIAWDFWIGGYQPVQKWLKDRRGRILTADDILYWQKIVVALVNTDSIMKEIDTLWKP